MVEDAPRHEARELSEQTWPAFERLFSQGNGWDFCWCMYFQRGRHLPRTEFPTRAQQGVRNRQEKRQLVEAGRAHGIVVFADSEPVGWCQYGPAAELRGGRSHPLPDGVDSVGRSWRITCFVVHKAHRRRGVAAVALGAALDAIRRQGGGPVEAYPIVGGPPSAAHGGIVSMFEREGFRVVARLGTGVVMRRVV